MAQLLSSSYHYSKALLLLPITHVCTPILRLWWLVFKHTIAYPAIVMFRTFLFAFVYLPLTPFLYAANISYDANVPVEVWLYRLLSSLRPHVAFFVVQSTHYFVISLFMGSAVGIVAGFNISLISRIFNLSSKLESSSASDAYTQTTPYVDKLTEKLANKPNLNSSGPTKTLLKDLMKELMRELDLLQRRVSEETIKAAILLSESKSNSLGERNPNSISKQPSSVKIEPGPETPKASSKNSGIAGVDATAIAQSQSKQVLGQKTDFPSGTPKIDFNNKKPDPLEVISRTLYEDDDGYGIVGFSEFDSPESQVIASRAGTEAGTGTGVAKERRKRERRLLDSKFSSGALNPAMAEMIIEEEGEKEESPMLPSSSFESPSPSVKLSGAGLPTLASLDGETTDKLSSNEEIEESSILTARSSDEDN